MLGILFPRVTVVIRAVISRETHMRIAGLGLAGAMPLRCRRTLLRLLRSEHMRTPACTLLAFRGESSRRAAVPVGLPKTGVPPDHSTESPTSDSGAFY